MTNPKREKEKRIERENQFELDRKERIRKEQLSIYELINELEISENLKRVLECIAMRAYQDKYFKEQ